MCKGIFFLLHMYPGQFVMHPNKRKHKKPPAEGVFIYFTTWIGMPMATSAASIVISPNVG